MNERGECMKEVSCSAKKLNEVVKYGNAFSWLKI